jgi:hypothetical protein
MRNSRWTKRHWDRCLSEYFGFHLSLLFHQCYIHVFVSTPFLTKGQAGWNVETIKQSNFFPDIGKYVHFMDSEGSRRLCNLVYPFIHEVFRRVCFKRPLILNIWINTTAGAQLQTVTVDTQHPLEIHTTLVHICNWRQTMKIWAANDNIVYYHVSMTYFSSLYLHIQLSVIFKIN